METRKLICIIILFAINLLNYMDRYTIAGVLNDVMKFYKISNKAAGFLQTVFIIFFMIFAPICGFLGDRCNRKRIIIVGEIIWTVTDLASSFIPEEQFWLFVLLRGIVGIGEASYAVIAPTLIADLFANEMRSRILMWFYFAIPVGSGLGYVLSSTVTTIAKGNRNECPDCWQWGIRSTNMIGLITLIALIVAVEEPKRGQAENVEENDKQNEAKNSAEITGDGKKRHWKAMKADLVYLARNQTFVWSTIGYTAVVFVTGTLTWWSPAAIEEAVAWHQNVSDTSKLPNKNAVALNFGIITCLGGLVGVGVGSILAMAWKRGKWFFAGNDTPKADPIISAIGSFAAAPLMFFSLLLIDLDHLELAWVILFFTIVCLCLNWAVNVDMLMSIIVPHRRSIASAVQILISHAFGDACGPWIVGAISDWVRGPGPSTPAANFQALVVSFYLPNFLLFLSGFAFLAASFTLPQTIREMDEWKNSKINPAPPPEDQNEDEENSESTSTRIVTISDTNMHEITQPLPPHENFVETMQPPPPTHEYYQDGSLPPMNPSLASEQ